MKIAEVCPVFPPYKGGIGTACEQNARMYAQAGHEVTVFTPRYRSLGVPVSSSTQDTVHVRYLRPWFEYGNAAWLPQLLWKLKGFDVVHLHYPAPGLILACLLSQRLRPTQKLYVTYHMDLVGAGQGIKERIFNYYNTHIAPRLVRKAEKVFVSSKDYALHSHVGAYMQEHQEKFHEIPFGVDTSFFSPRDTVALRTSLGIKPEEKVILFVGGLDKAHYFKGVEYLLEAFELIMHKERFNSSHNMYRLVIVGGGDLKSHYEDFAQHLALGDRVIFCSGVPTADLPVYYSMGDISVLPSIDSSEAFGIVLLEAMACGTPVVASSLPGVRTVVAPQETGLLVKPRDIEGLASAMYTLVNNEALLRAMSANAVARVKDLYSYEAVSKKLNHAL